jgi:DNA polymerase-3 subunit delta
MAIIEAQNFYQQIESAQLKPVYFLFGEESYLLAQSTQRFKALFDGTGLEDFNFQSFYAGDANVDQIRESIETLPMMSAYRIVLVKEAQNFSEKDWEVLEPILSKPVTTSVVAFLASSVDKRKKGIRLLIDKSQAVEFKKPYENQMPSWIQYIAKTFELTITAEASNLLHTLVGTHLIEIDSEMKKLKDYISPRNKIELSDVAAVVSRSKEESVFDFTRAVGENNRAVALEHLVHLLDQGQSEIGVVALLARHVRLLLIVKKGMSQGLHGAKLAQLAQVSPYFIDSYVSQAKLWSSLQLQKVLLILSETDKALKSSPLSSHIWLENMVLKSCSTLNFGTGLQESDLNSDL